MHSADSGIGVLDDGGIAFPGDLDFIQRRTAWLFDSWQYPSPLPLCRFPFQCFFRQFGAAVGQFNQFDLTTIRRLSPDGLKNFQHLFELVGWHRDVFEIGHDPNRLEAVAVLGQFNDVSVS